MTKKILSQPRPPYSEQGYLDFKSFDLKDLHLERIVSSPLPYELRLVSYIDGTQRSQLVNDQATGLSMLNHCTVKFEGVERFTPQIHSRCYWLGMELEHDGPISCHLFWAPKHGASFALHTDPDCVVLHVLEGEKFLQVGDESVVLQQGDWYMIPPNMPHLAVNACASKVLSFGLEDYLSDKV